MTKLIILLGQRVRSGTNFVGSTLSQHPDVVTLPNDSSLGEFNLFNDNAIKTVFTRVNIDSFGIELDNDDEALFLKNYGEAWLQTLIQKYKVPQDKVLFIKSPSVKYLSLWKAAFPKSKIAIICRDGRDNVISSVRASNDKRTWHTFMIRLKKKINYSSGRSFINHTKQWAKTAHDVSSVTKSSQIAIYKYEVLNNSEAAIGQLLKHYELPVSDVILKKCMDAPVMGSSFGIKSDGMIKPNWQPDMDKSKYTFSNKWKTWNIVKKLVFKSLAGKELINLDFEINNDW